MATLAAQIQTELAVLIAAKTLVDWSRQRIATQTEDTALIAKTALHAAAFVEAFLGDGIEDDDVVAVDIGVRLAILRLSTVYSSQLSDNGTKYIKDVKQDLKDLAEQRRNNLANIELSTPDFVRVDKELPDTPWKIPD